MNQISSESLINKWLKTKLFRQDDCKITVNMRENKIKINFKKIIIIEIEIIKITLCYDKKNLK